MKSLIHFLLAIFFAGVCSSSCKKSSKNDEAQVFKWKVDNGTERLADNISFIRLLGVNIFSGTIPDTTVSLTTYSTDPGTYTPTLANAGFQLTIAGIQYSSQSGSIIITSNANFKLNGFFNTTFLINANTVSVSGTFSNLSYY